MPRSGHHPLKIRGLKIEDKIKDITIATIVYIPALEGYWEESLEVLKIFFQSLFQNTSLPYDLMVLDNGSCAEVQEYLSQLKDEGEIQFLIFSEINLRKLGGLNLLLSAAPGKIISYTDSDAYFLPGWLEASLEVLNAFPQAGTVTAQPLEAGNVPEKQAEFLDELQKNKGIKIQVGNLIPEEYYWARLVSLGHEHLAPKSERQDVLVTKENVSAYLTGSDFQFTTTRTIVQPFLPLEITNINEYNDPIYSPVLHTRLQAAGFNGFSTKEYLVHHMGNRVPNFQNELPWINHLFQEQTQERRVTSGKNLTLRSVIKSEILKRTAIRRFLKKINTLSYKLLYEA